MLRGIERVGDARGGSIDGNWYVFVGGAFALPESGFGWRYSIIFAIVSTSSASVENLVKSSTERLLLEIAARLAA